jgi:hypothetical protein
MNFWSISPRSRATTWPLRSTIKLSGSRSVLAEALVPF